MGWTKQLNKQCENQCMDQIFERLNRIQTMLSTASSENIDVFGASSHKWQHNNPISSESVDVIESYFDIKLPSEYRHFILKLTDGGAGPDHGLLPLFKSVKWKMDHGQTDILRIPFIHTEPYYESDDPIVIDADNRESTNEITSDERYRIIDYCYAGTLDICDMGCGYTYKLIITGPARGFVWQDLSAVDQGMLPTGKKFLEWYEDWLITTLTKNANLDEKSIM